MDTKPGELKDLENINIPLAYVKGEPYLNIPEDLYQDLSKLFDKEEKMTILDNNKEVLKSLI